MASTFEIKYCLSEKEKRKIFKKCRVRLSVEWNDGVKHTKKFYHCLHCNTTFARSGFHYHQQDINLTPQRKEALAMRFLSNPTNHKSIIQDEFERCFVNGKLKRRITVSSSPNHPFDFTPIQPQEQPSHQVFHRTERPATDQHYSDDFPVRLGENVCEEQVEEQIQDFQPELNGCFSSEGFITERFDEFARDFLSNVPETSEDFQKQRNEKAKIVSVLAQNLYIMCTLTKDQIKNVTSFWKAMIAFIAPEYTDIAKKIHASYSSCLREAQRKREAIEARHLELFRDCLYFSLALDTAQFGRDTFLSCVCRFGFDECVFQEIILFDKIYQKTGHDLADFVFEKLNAKNCDFTKMVSITTDGAKNMIGQFSGMANEIVKMANERYGTSRRFGADVHSVWCIDHRLNLVAQDFKEVPNINFVLAFINWITANERLVSYSAFARRTQRRKKKKIPAPSETRWLFYRDSLKALLDQTDTVEEFLKLPGILEKWEAYIATPTHPLGVLKDVIFSFQHPLVNAHFRFSLFILDILGDLNTLFQTKYSFVNYFWEYLVVLHQFLVGELRKMEEGDFGRFVFLNSVRNEDRPQFVDIMKHLILNLQVRFYRPSFSLDKRSIKKFLNYDTMSICPEAPIGDCSRCGLSPLFELFNVRQTRSNTQYLSHLVGLRVDEEMDRLVPFFCSDRDLILRKHLKEQKSVTHLRRG